MRNRRSGADIGLLLGSSQTPAQMLAAASAAERVGVDELWVSEDYYFTGAISAAGALLAETSLPLGIGIVPAVTRHPALLAMELATLAGMYPGRLSAGIGGGVPEWLNGMGLRPRSPLGSVRDTVAAVRTLLGGETLRGDYETFCVDDVALEHPPADHPPIYVGASGPKALRQAGAIADGTVLSVLAGPDYVRWARDQLTQGGAGPDHRVVVYAMCAVDDDATLAREMLRELVGIYLLTGPRNPMTTVQGIADEAEELASRGFDAGVAAIPSQWIDDLTIAGTPQECRDRINQLSAAGADAIVLYLPPEVEAEPMIQRLADAVLAQ